MGWADAAIKKLRQGKPVHMKPPGSSRLGQLSADEFVTILPCKSNTLAPGDRVLVQVKGHVLFLDIVTVVEAGNRFQVRYVGSSRIEDVDAQAIYGIVVQKERMFTAAALEHRATTALPTPLPAVRAIFQEQVGEEESYVIRGDKSAFSDSLHFWLVCTRFLEANYPNIWELPTLATLCEPIGQTTTQNMLSTWFRSRTTTDVESIYMPFVRAMLMCNDWYYIAMICETEAEYFVFAWYTSA